MTWPIIEQLFTDLIEVPPGRRDLDEPTIHALSQSMATIGLKTPITIRSDEHEEGETAILVTGAHRLEAAKRLGWKEIDCFVLNCNEVEAELWEIAENLHRSDLTKEQRDQHIRRYAELLKAQEEREIPSVQNEPLEIGYKKPPPAPKGMAQKIAEKTGLSKSTVRRALNPAPSKPASRPGKKQLDADPSTKRQVETLKKVWNLNNTLKAAWGRSNWRAQQRFIQWLEGGPSEDDDETDDQAGDNAAVIPDLPACLRRTG